MGRENSISPRVEHSAPEELSFVLERVGGRISANTLLGFALRFASLYHHVYNPESGPSSDLDRLTEKVLAELLKHSSSIILPLRPTTSLNGTRPPFAQIEWMERSPGKIFFNVRGGENDSQRRLVSLFRREALVGMPPNFILMIKRGGRGHLVAGLGLRKAAALASSLPC